MRQLTTGELFFGYGGLGMAVNEVFNSRTVWLSDIDPGPNKIAAHRYLDVPNLGDVSAIDWSQVEPVDIICGGSPCQDLSTAGRRAGMTDGTRSNLWVMMREAIAHIRPQHVVWENVRGAYSARADSAMESDPGLLGDHPAGQPALRALGRVLGDLADLGYDARWCGLRAADVGAPHGRFRVFLLATRRDAADADQPRLEGQQDQAGASPAGRHGHALAGAGGLDLTLLPTPTSSDTNGPGVHGQGGPDLRSAIGLLQAPSAADATAGHSVSIEDAVHGLQLLPTPRATDGTKGGPNQRGSSGDLMLPSAVTHLLQTPSVADATGGHERRGGSRGGELLLNGQMKEVASLANWGKYAAAIARWEAIHGPAPAPTMTSPRSGNQQLSPAFTEWMMGLSAGWITDVPGITRNEALKACGNGVVPLQAAAALRHMIGADTR